MNKKACFLLAGVMLFSGTPAKAQTSDLFDLTLLTFSGAGELIQCNSPYLDISYSNCNNYWNYFLVGEHYAHAETNYSITIDTKQTVPCVYNKYLADPTDGDLLWQSYLVACGLQNNLVPTADWEFNGTPIGEVGAVYGAADYEFAQELLTLPLQLKIKHRKIYYYQNPLISEFKLEKKIKGHWVTKYDRIVGDLGGQEEKLKRGYYRLTVTRFDGTVIYRKKFKV